MMFDYQKSYREHLESVPIDHLEIAMNHTLTAAFGSNILSENFMDLLAVYIDKRAKQKIAEASPQ